jgi:nicotinamidase/pyrazinamidase
VAASTGVESKIVADALLVIDFQNDFTPGGALAVDEGDLIGDPIKRLAPHFDVIAATRDWHPPDHASFETAGGPWPVHCVQDSPGAELHPAMQQVDVDFIVEVGRERDDEGYSGFEKSNLADRLRERGVEKVAVCGLATDYCVRASAIDACREGFDVTLVSDAVRAVEVEPGDGERAIEDMKAAGAKVATSDEILSAAPTDGRG